MTGVRRGIRWTTALLLSAATLACAKPGDRNSAETRNLLDQLPSAAVTAPAPAAEHVLARSSTLRGQEQPALFMHPPSQVEFPPVTLGQLPVFVAAIGLDDSVAEKAGDGVDFTLSLRLADGTITEVWSKYLDNRKNDADKGWQPVRVSLERFAGQTVRIILSTSVGSAGDPQFDWAFWGRPQLITESR